MGEIRPKTCEGRGLTKNQLGGHHALRERMEQKPYPDVLGERG